jgi:hypothetical protein
VPDQLDPCAAVQAPEQFKGCSVTDIDVFAFGVLLWECFEQQQPWKELSPMQIIYSVGLQVRPTETPCMTVCCRMMWNLVRWN